MKFCSCPCYCRYWLYVCNFGRVHISTIHTFTYGTYQQSYRETQCLFCVFVTSVILMLGVTFECYCSLYRTTRTAVSIVFYILRRVPQNNQAFFPSPVSIVYKCFFKWTLCVFFFLYICFRYIQSHLFSSINKRMFWPLEPLSIHFN